VLGAANPNGLPDDYMQTFGPRYASPIVNGADPGLPGRARRELVTSGWNIVYMPYCTGDVHTGDAVAVYADPTGAEPPLTWHHRGHRNTLAAISWAREAFPRIEKLLVTGFSAGGTGTAANYHFVRGGLAPQRGYFLDDSGPIFLAPNAAYRSRALHEQIRASWALDPVFAKLPPGFDPNDLGSIHGALARTYPRDRLAYTGFSRDYNYSRFSYERFHEPNDRESIHAYWKEDQDRLLAELRRHDNWGYFVPYHRPFNASHCTTVITFAGSQACEQMGKKRTLREYLQPPWGQTWTCRGSFVGMETFLDRFVGEDAVVRVEEPPNSYNAEDPGMRILAPLIDAALAD
jgi:hypothetical protein